MYAMVITAVLVIVRPGFEYPVSTITHRMPFVSLQDCEENLETFGREIERALANSLDQLWVEHHKVAEKDDLFVDYYSSCEHVELHEHFWNLPR